MKQSLLTFLLGSVIAASGGLPAVAQTESQEPIFEIASKDDFDLCQKDVFSYSRDCAWEWYNYSGGYLRLWYSLPYGANKHYTDDYLTTPEINFESGSMYSLECIPLSYFSDKAKAATFEVRLGQGEDIENGYNVLATFPDLPNSGSANEAYKKNVNFTVPADGNYRISLRGSKDCLKVYNLKIYNLGVSSIPNDVTDFTVTPDATGATQAILTFKLPSTTLTGQTLSGAITYNISRDGTSVKEDTGTPGQTVTWTDTAAPEGTVSYSVTATCGQETSSAVETTTFIGLETPSAVGNPRFSSEGNVHTLTWEVPTGIHGVELNPATLSYSISRIIGNDATELGTATGSTTYTDTYAATAPVLLSYRITASNGSKTSAPAETSKVKIGHIDLPFSDSFAEGVFGSAWDLEQVSGTGKWEAYEKYYIGRAGSTDIFPADGDGGLAGFSSFAYNSTHSSRLVTAPISKSSSTTPAVEFYFHHDTGSTKNDRVQLQVSCDNGEWTDVANGEIKRKDGEKEGWEKYVILLGDALAADCTTYRIGFLAKSDYGNNMAIDAVRVFNAVENDLEVTLEGPSKITAGTDATLTIMLSNNGSTPIAADAYTLSLSTDLETEIELPETLSEIPALSVVRIPVTIRMDAIQAKAASSYTFTATAEYASDAAPDNNTSAPLVMNTQFAQHSAVTQLAIEKDADGSHRLEWEPAGDPTYTPLSILEDFESLEDGATGDFNGFKSIDLDGKGGDTWYLCSGKELNVFAPHSTVEVKGTKAIGVTIAANTQQDDWLISPALTAADISTFELKFKIGFRDRSYAHTYEVRYATEEYDPANPAAAFTNLVKKETSSAYSSEQIYANNKLNSRTFSDIPAEAKYIAVHLCTKMSYTTATWIDDVEIREINPAPLTGYNVYQEGVGRLNAEPIPASQLQFVLESITAPADGSSPAYFVTAVYPDGETTPSPVVTLDLPKAPQNLSAELRHDVFSGRNDILLAWEAPADVAADTEVTYTVRINGQQHASTSETAYTAENMPSAEHAIEVCAVIDGLTSPAATTTFAINDEDYAKASFSVTSNNDFIPEGITISLISKDAPDGTKPYILTPVDNAAEIGFLPKGNYAASTSAPLYHPWSTDIELDGDKHTVVNLEEIIVAPFNVTVEIIEIDCGDPMADCIGYDPEYILSWNRPKPGEEPIEMGRVTDYSITLDGTPYGDNTIECLVRLEGITEGMHTAGVRANYVSGASEESTAVFYGLSALNSIETANAVVTGLQGAIRIAVNGTTNAEVYNAAGVPVALLNLADETVIVPATPGIYVVALSGATVKVAVR